MSTYMIASALLEEHHNNPANAYFAFRSSQVFQELDKEKVAEIVSFLYGIANQ